MSIFSSLLGGLKNYGGGSVLGGLFGGKDNTGIFQGLLGGLGGLAQLYQASKMTGLAQDNLDFNKNLTNRNLANQTALLNDQKRKSALTRLSAQGLHGDALSKAVAQDIGSNELDGSTL